MIAFHARTQAIWQRLLASQQQPLMAAIPLVAQAAADIAAGLAAACAEVSAQSAALQQSALLLAAFAEVNAGVARELRGQGLQQLVSGRGAYHGSLVRHLDRSRVAFSLLGCNRTAFHAQYRLFSSILEL